MSLSSKLFTFGLHGGLLCRGPRHIITHVHWPSWRGQNCTRIRCGQATALLPLAVTVLWSGAPVLCMGSGAPENTIVILGIGGKAGPCNVIGTRVPGGKTGPGTSRGTDTLVL